MLLVLDHEQRVAFVAQVVHHSHEPADIAWMQTNRRFVHDEESVDERRAETRRQIHALHFAAAEGARRAIEREITDADFAEITQARTNFVAQHVGGRIGGGYVDLGEKIARIGDGARGKFGKGEM